MIDVRIVASRSGDGGISFAASVVVSDAASGVPSDSDIFPVAAVGDDGDLTVAWYDRRLDEANNLFVDYYAAMSEDGGASFGPNERISDVSSPIYLDPNLANCYHGDYDQQPFEDGSPRLIWRRFRALAFRFVLCSLMTK